MPRLSFGVYDPFSAAPLDVVATFTYDCPPGQVVRVELDRGSSGQFAYRTMRSGANVLRYNVFLDAARTRIWGDGTGGSTSGPDHVVRNGTLSTAYVYARIYAGQDPAIGDYADTLRVTIQF